MQDWHKLIEDYDTVVPTRDFIEGKNKFGKEVAPILAADQQNQIKTLSMQHCSRLQAQKQLNATLQDTLAAAGKLPTC